MGWRIRAGSCWGGGRPCAGGRGQVSFLSRQRCGRVRRSPDVCCLRWTNISRVRTSHTRTSPSKPPVTRNLRLFDMTMLVTPPLGAAYARRVGKGAKAGRAGVGLAR